jgi:hypothetical protein
MKDRYVALRNAGKMSYEFLYEYFTSVGGKVKKEQFNLLYQQTCTLDETLEHLDKKFELTLLVDAEYKFIKVVE